LGPALNRSRVVEIHRQLAELHRELADELSREDAGGDGMVDQYHSPLGKRKHLELVRDGVLRGYKPDRVHVFVEWAEIHSYLRSHPATPKLARGRPTVEPKEEPKDGPARIAKRIRAELGMRKRA